MACRGKILKRMRETLKKNTNVSLLAAGRGECDAGKGAEGLCWISLLIPSVHKKRIEEAIKEVVQFYRGGNGNAH